MTERETYQETRQCHALNTEYKEMQVNIMTEWQIYIMTERQRHQRDQYQRNATGRLLQRLPTYQMSVSIIKQRNTMKRRLEYCWSAWGPKEWWQCPVRQNAMGPSKRMKQTKAKRSSDPWTSARHAPATVRLVSTSGVPPNQSESSRFTAEVEGHLGWRSTQLEQAKDVGTSDTSKQIEIL